MLLSFASVSIFLICYLAIPTLLLSFLQLFLCRKHLTWGCILPIFSLCVSVLAFLMLLLNIASIGWVPVLLTTLAALAVLNIPTLIFWLIYRAEKKRQRMADVDRTRIDDLE